MIGWLKQLITKREAIDDLPHTVKHSQQALDTESRSFLLRDSDLLPPFALNTYLNLYLTDSLAATIIDADTRLTVADVECFSEEDDLCEYVNEFNRRIDLTAVLYDLVRDCNLYGFSIHEIVGNGSSLLESTEILGLKRIDPRFIVIEKDEYGRVKAFKQRPSFSLITGQASASASPFPFERILDPASVVYVRNSSPFTSYGQSLLEAVKKPLTRRAELLDAAVVAAKNHANPTIHASYTTATSQGIEVRENREEIEKRLAALKRAVKQQAEDNSKYVVTAGKGEHTFRPIGHPSIPDLTALIEYETTDALIAVGLNPQSLGFSFGAAATSFEASDRMLINNILTKQRGIVSQLQTKLYKLLPLIESDTPSGEILIRMKPPTLESLKDQYEAESIKINNVERLWRNGAMSDEQGARELGLHDIADKERWDEWLNGNEQAQPNPNDPNAAQAVDAATRSLSNGKQPSNNPTGQRGSEYANNSNGKVIAGRFDGDSQTDAFRIRGE
jgi:hypothetical protein